MYDDDLFDNLITTDVSWWSAFSFRLEELAANSVGQAALLPVDDLLAAKKFVACPRRGAHLKITDCWLCYGDWAWGHATASDVLMPGGDA